MSNADRTHIVLLNGPPRVGKDTIARLMMLAIREKAPAIDVYVDRFAKPLNDAIIAGHGLTEAEYAQLEATKDVPSRRLHGRSLREARIGMGQQYFKPLFGQTYFGSELVRRLQARDTATHRSPIVVLVPDLGFEEEAHPLKNSPAALTVVQLRRKACDYSNDCRTYVDALGVHETIQNDGSLEDLEATARAIVASRLGPWLATFPNLPSFAGD